MTLQVRAHLDTLHKAICDVICTSRRGEMLRLGGTFERVAQLMRKATSGDNKIMFVGNGGSASIASHMAIDFSKNGKMRALAFNDGAMLTCLGNDLGYERVFAEQIGFHGRRGDVLVAISSSGRSPNILSAIEAGRTAECSVITFTGFSSDNPARSAGDYNFYIQSPEYGIVEVAHLALIHALLDLTISEALAATDEVRPKDSKVSALNPNTISRRSKPRSTAATISPATIERGQAGIRLGGTGLSDEHATNRT